MNADPLSTWMDSHGIKRMARYPIAGYCWVALHDGREGTGGTFDAALLAAQDARAAA